MSSMIETKTIIRRPDKRGRRKHHKDTVLYHGFIAPQPEVLAAAETSALYRSTHYHTLRRVEDEAGRVWIFRRFEPGAKTYLGEMVLTESGKTRVHLWRAEPQAAGRDINSLDGGCRNTGPVAEDYSQQWMNIQ